jgi:hypothetical protein
MFILAWNRTASRIPQSPKRLSEFFNCRPLKGLPSHIAWVIQPTVQTTCADCRFAIQ